MKEQRRGDAFAGFLNTFIAVSKKKFENPAEEKSWDVANAVILRKLNEAEFSEFQFKVAMKWILTGDPARYREFTLADFYPTETQLDQIEFDFGKELGIEYERGRKSGYEAGYAAGWDAARNEIIELRKKTGREK